MAGGPHVFSTGYPMQGMGGQPMVARRLSAPAMGTLKSMVGLRFVLSLHRSVWLGHVGEYSGFKVRVVS